jgi:hypothetical protein
MTGSDYKEVYRDWSIIVTVEAWSFGTPPNERFVPTVAVVRPEKLQQRFLDIGGGAAFLHRRDALQHGLTVARMFVDAEER